MTILNLKLTELFVLTVPIKVTNRSLCCHVASRQKLQVIHATEHLQQSIRVSVSCCLRGSAVCKDKGLSPHWCYWSS